jgi:hypothetical protein
MNREQVLSIHFFKDCVKTEELHHLIAKWIVFVEIYLPEIPCGLESFLMGAESL